MDEQIDNKPDKAEPHIRLISDCSSMDNTVVNRLRATMDFSLEWADQALDVLINLDDDLQAFDAKVKQQIQSLHIYVGEVQGKPDSELDSLEMIAQQLEQSVQYLRNGVREVMMSMQSQDVIGQAVERAATALEKRLAAINRAVDSMEDSLIPTNEIEEIHRVYRIEDDMHRAA